MLTPRKLSALRRKLGLTIKEAAKAMNMSATTIGKMERLHGKAARRWFAPATRDRYEAFLINRNPEPNRRAVAAKKGPLPPDASGMLIEVIRSIVRDEIQRIRIVSE